MTKDRKKDDDLTLAAADQLILEEIVALSDEEIVAGMAPGEDDRMRALVEAAYRQVGKEKLASAKAGLAAARREEKVVNLDREKMKRRLQDMTDVNDELGERLTLAARKLDTESGLDVDDEGLLEDLADLFDDEEGDDES